MDIPLRLPVIICVSFFSCRNLRMLVHVNLENILYTWEKTPEFQSLRKTRMASQWRSVRWQMSIALSRKTTVRYPLLQAIYRTLLV